MKPPYFYVSLNYFVSKIKSQGANLNAAGSKTFSFVKKFSYSPCGASSSKWNLTSSLLIFAIYTIFSSANSLLITNTFGFVVG